MPLPPYKRPKPNPFTPPMAIRRLPFNLKRNALYPRQPKRAAQAAQQYFRYMAGAPMPTYLPQRMAFQQFKTTPAGQRRNWLSSANSWAELTQKYTHGVPNRVARKVGPYPHYPIQAAAATRGMNMMPQPPRHLTPVIARQVRQNDATSRMRGRAEPPPSAWATAQHMNHLRARHIRMVAHEAALSGSRAAVVRGIRYR